MSKYIPNKFVVIFYVISNGNVKFKYIEEFPIRNFDLKISYIRMFSMHILIVIILVFVKVKLNIT